MNKSVITLACLLWGIQPASAYGASDRIIEIAASVGKKAGSGASGKNPKLFHPDPDDPSNNFEEGEVVVANPPKGFITGVGGLGYRVLDTETFDSLGFTMMRVRIPRGHGVPEAVRELKRRYPGLTIDANHNFTTQSSKVTARAAMRWKRASAACGAGIRMGMIDSGVDTSHPALRNQNITFRSFHRKGRKPGRNVHGTAIASMLVGAPKWGGLLPGARLMAASMFETNKKGRSVGTAIGLLRSLNWLAKSRVDVINVSAAGSDNRVLKIAFDAARKKKLLLVAAAGNWNSKEKPAYPAGYKHVIAVTAIANDGTVFERANQGKYIDFSAPGVRIYAAVPGGGRVMSGTSFAAPYITAALASEVVFGGSRGRSRLVRKLSKSVKDLGRSGKDKVFGYGLVTLKPKCS